MPKETPEDRVPTLDRQMAPQSRRERKWHGSRGIAAYIGAEYRCVVSREWRKRVGLPAFKIGGLIQATEEELDVWLEGQRERRV